jgi:hypothetical protein
MRLCQEKFLPAARENKVPLTFCRQKGRKPFDLFSADSMSAALF